MKQKIYQIDAFTSRVFAGNPAAVCPLDQWLSDALMQNIAMENNLAETAFVVRTGSHYEIRWFTPTNEVDLCGHATLAAAYALFNFERATGDVITFHSPRSGILTVTRQGEVLTLNFPADVVTEVAVTKEMVAGFNLKPKQAFKGITDYMLIFESEDQVQSITPFFDAIARLDCRGVIVTAPGKDVDFVSRFFAPQSGIDEDPVTGSAHTTLIPYWAGILNKSSLTARQLSQRGGDLSGKLLNNRVEISGRCQPYLVGEILLAGRE